jgi:hypothetical protein
MRLRVAGDLFFVIFREQTPLAALSRQQHIAAQRTDMIERSYASGCIPLNNKLTPKTYKNMEESEFLNTNCTLAKILKFVLEKE